MPNSSSFDNAAINPQARARSPAPIAAPLPPLADGLARSLPGQEMPLIPIEPPIAHTGAVPQQYQNVFNANPNSRRRAYRRQIAQPYAVRRPTQIVVNNIQKASLPPLSTSPGEALNGFAQNIQRNPNLGISPLQPGATAPNSVPSAPQTSSMVGRQLPAPLPYPSNLTGETRHMINLDITGPDSVIVTMDNNSRVQVIYLDEVHVNDPTRHFQSLFALNPNATSAFVSPYTPYIYGGQFRTEEQKMLTGEAYNPDATSLIHQRTLCRETLDRFAATGNPSELLGLFHSVTQPAEDRYFAANLRIGRNFCCYYGRVNIGSNVVIGHDCSFVDAREIRIGNYCWIGNNVSIYTSAVVPSEIVGSRLEIAARVTIEERVTVGDNVRLLGGITIGRGCVIGAGSVVNVNLPPGSVWPFRGEMPQVPPPPPPPYNSPQSVPMERSNGSWNRRTTLPRPW